MRYVWREVALNAVILVTRTGSELVGVFLLSPLITQLTRVHAQPGAAEAGFFGWLTGGDPTSVSLRGLIGLMALSQLVLVSTVFGRPIAEARLSTGLMTHLRSALYDHLQHLAFQLLRPCAQQPIDRATAEGPRTPSATS